MAHWAIFVLFCCLTQQNERNLHFLILLCLFDLSVLWYCGVVGIVGAGVVTGVGDDGGGVCALDSHYQFRNFTETTP